MSRIISFLFFLLVSFAFCAGAFAACSSPAGVEGEVEYMSSSFYYCDGTNWVDMGYSSPDELDTSIMPTSGLVGYWDMDDGSGTTATDSSGNSNDGTLTNSPTWATGYISGAVEAAADDEYIDVGDPAGGELDFGTGDFSVSLWVYIDGYVNQSSSINAILSKRGLSAVNVAGYSFYYKSTHFPVFEMADGSSTAKVTGTTSLQGGWHHLVGLRTGGTIQLYVDGTKEGTDGSMATDISSAQPLIFLSDPSSGYAYRNIDGKLDDVRIYNRALTPEEIKCLGGQSTYCSLVGYWKMDETSGTTVTDSSTSGNDGTMAGSMDASADSVAGQVDTALDFDGSDDLIDLGSVASGNPLMLNGSSATWAAWVYRKSAGDRYSRIIDKSDNTNAANGWSFYVDNNVQYDITVSIDGTTYDSDSTANYSQNTWTHFAAVFDDSADTIKFYLDGRLIFGEAATATIPDVTTNARIGSWNHTTGAEWKGYIDDLRIYNRALSRTEIETLVGISDHRAFMGHWKLDETSGTTAADSSGMGNDGTMGGGLSGATDSVSGQIDTALNFDGIGDYIASGFNPVNYAGREWTTSAWFKSSSTTAQSHAILGARVGTGATGSEFEVYFKPDTDDLNIALGDSNSGGSVYTCVTGTNYFDGGWHQVVITAVHADTLKCYVDGVLKLTQAITSSQVNSNIDLPEYGIGAVNEIDNGVYNHFFEGSIDDVRIWDRALSQDEAEGLFCTGSVGKIDYNTTDEIMQFCSDVGRHDMSSTNPGTGGGGCSATGTIAAGVAGTWQYDTTNKKMVFCDGTNWRNAGE